MSDNAGKWRKETKGLIPVPSLEKKVMIPAPNEENATISPTTGLVVRETPVVKSKTILDDPILYLIMRTDLDSLGPGKGMAQACHAYGAVKKVVRQQLVIKYDFLAWMSQTDQEFGTTIVLGGTVHEIDTLLHKAAQNNEMASGWVHDPTYPVSDGDIIHVLPLDTCGFLFGERRYIKDLTKELNLYGRY